MCVSVDIFVPPWNSYDVSTLKAADRAGFRFFSSYLADPVDTTLSLSFVPCTTSLRSLKEHIDLARSTAGGVVVVLFHGYDFYESRSPNASATLGQLEETLRWLGEQNDVVVARMGELSGLKGTRLNLAATEYGKAVARRGESLELIRRYIPPGLRELASKGVVATIWLFYGGLVFATWVGSFFVAALFRGRIRTRISRIIAIVEALALLAVWAYVFGFRFSRLGYITLSAVCVATSYCIGTWGAIFLMNWRSARNTSKKS